MSNPPFAKRSCEMIGGWEVAQVTATSDVREASQDSHDSIEVGAHHHDLLQWGRRGFHQFCGREVFPPRVWAPHAAAGSRRTDERPCKQFHSSRSTPPLVHVTVTIGVPPRGVKPMPMATRPATGVVGTRGELVLNTVVTIQPRDLGPQ